MRVKQPLSPCRGRLPFQRRGTAPLVVQCYTTLRGTASPVASPRPQQCRFVSFRTALPRLRSPCTSTPAAPCHLRSPCTSTPAAPCKGPAAAEGASSTWNVPAVTVVSAIVAYATIHVGIAPACNLIIVKHPAPIGGCRFGPQVNPWLGKTMVILSKWPKKHVFLALTCIIATTAPHPVRFGGQRAPVMAAVSLGPHSPVASPRHRASLRHTAG